MKRMIEFAFIYIVGFITGAGVVDYYLDNNISYPKDKIVYIDRNITTKVPYIVEKNVTVVKYLKPKIEVTYDINRTE
jgi:hypothetical protein